MLNKIEKIALGIGVVVLVGVGIKFFGSIYDGSVYVADRGTQQIGAIKEMEYVRYEGKTVDGNTVIAAIRDSEKATQGKIKIVVDTLKNTANDTYGYDNDGDTSFTGYSITDPANISFINPTGNFKPALTRNNGVVTTITFTQE